MKSLMEINEEGVYSTDALQAVYEKYPDLPVKDRNLYTRLVEGTMEHLLTLDYCLNQISKLPVAKMKPMIRSLLRMSAYQILYLNRIPDHAVCNEAVEIAKRNGAVSLKGFVNGVLRNLARKKNALQFPDPKKEPKQYLSVWYSMPEWIVEQWTLQLGLSKTQQVLKAFSGEKPLCAWVNTTRFSAEEVRKELEQEGVEVEEHPYLPQAFLLHGISGLERLSAFQKGMFYLQDTSSVLAAALCGAKENMRIFDVCGAPGGKSLYLANCLNGTGEVLCRDLSASKVSRIEENIRRMGFSNMKAQIQDACELRKEDLASADLVVADLPCSGLGVAGRKSDIRYRIRPKDVENLALLQRKILGVVSGYVKPGGKLLYSTCTISGKENEENVRWIREHLPLEPVPLQNVPRVLRKGTEQEGYLQLLPQDGIYHDGFFIALFQRRAQG